MGYRVQAVAPGLGEDRRELLGRVTFLDPADADPDDQPVQLLACKRERQPVPARDGRWL